jgi:long-chain acyl-CoA synthetase
VVGIPHRVLGEEVGAIVQLAPGSELSDAQLRAFAAERLAGFMVPVRIVLQRDPLPRNANGKIMKRDLKKLLGWV